MDVERRVKTIQQTLDRLDEAFIFAQWIDSTSDKRQRDRLREELTLARRSTVTPNRSMKSTLKASWRSRKHSAKGVRPRGAGLTRSQAAIAAAVFP